MVSSKPSDIDLVNDGQFDGDVRMLVVSPIEVRSIGDAAGCDAARLESRFGKFGLALAGKARGEDAGAWFTAAIGEDTEVKSISHEHTYMVDTAEAAQLETTLMRLSEMVGRRLREAEYQARTLQLKLRYSDFTTITRAHTLREPTHLDAIVFETVKRLFYRHCDRGRKVRLLGVALSSFTHGGEQLDLLDASRREKLERLSQATDALRDRFGFSKIQFGGSVTSTGKKSRD